MYTSHGHLILGTTVEERPNKIARCGGPRLCSVCSKESAEAIHRFDFEIKEPSNNLGDETERESTIKYAYIRNSTNGPILKVIITSPEHSLHVLPLTPEIAQQLAAEIATLKFDKI